MVIGQLGEVVPFSVKVIPGLTSISMVAGETPSSGLQVKELMSGPSVRCNGHIHRPPPNSRSSKFCHLTSMCEPDNLSGINSSGFSHIAGSTPCGPDIHQDLCVLRSGVSTDLHGPSGPAGEQQQSREMQPESDLLHRHLQVGQSSNIRFIYDFAPITCSNSPRAFISFSRLRSSSAIAHAIVLEVVSVPAANRSRTSLRN